MFGQLPWLALINRRPSPWRRPALQRSCVLCRLERRARARPRPAGVVHVVANKVSVGARVGSGFCV